jgi:uncharacterized protein
MHSQFSYEKMDQPKVLPFMFHPRPDNGTPPPDTADDQFLAIDNETIHLRYHLIEDHEAPVIIFFHGNGEIVADYDDMAVGYREQDISFIAAEYRGYGLSSGTPLASNMITDAHEILKAVTKKLDTLKYGGKLLVMGRSLGCAPAIELAASHPEQVKGLVLDSAFAFTIPVLKTIGVDVNSTGLSENDGFHNIEKIRTISMPTYMIHGQVDTIIDLNNAAELQMESPALQKQFQAVPGAEHNTIIDIAGRMYFEVLKRFINSMGKMRRKRTGVR